MTKILTAGRYRSSRPANDERREKPSTEGLNKTTLKTACCRSLITTTNVATFLLLTGALTLSAALPWAIVPLAVVVMVVAGRFLWKKCADKTALKLAYLASLISTHVSMILLGAGVLGLSAAVPLAIVPIAVVAVVACAPLLWKKHAKQKRTAFLKDNMKS